MARPEWCSKARPMAYQMLLSIVFGGAMIWGAVRFVRTRRLSHLLLLLLGLLPLVALFRPSPLILPAVIGLAVLRWFVQWRERRLPPGEGELDELSHFTREVTVKPRAELPPIEDSGAPKDATARDGWVELEVSTPAATLRCEGGRLAIDEGPLRARVRFEHERGEELDIVRMQLAFADREGQEWEVTSYFDAQPFTDFYENETLRALAPWSEAPETFRGSLEERCLLAGLSGLEDSHRQVELVLGSERYSVSMTFQRPRLDVASFGAGLLVRVSGLRGVRQRSARGVALETLPPFAFLAPARLLLCFSEPRYHFATAAHMQEYEARVAPTPRAVRLEGRGPEQASVVFHRDES